MIEKFPHNNDEFDIVTWEAIALSLAGKAGVSVPEMRIEMIEGKPVLLLQRFDRMATAFEHDDLKAARKKK